MCRYVFLLGNGPVTSAPRVATIRTHAMVRIVIGRRHVEGWPAQPASCLVHMAPERVTIIVGDLHPVPSEVSSMSNCLYF